MMRFLLSVVLTTGAVHAAYPGQNQLEMNDCAAAEYQRADAQLNAAWPAAKAQADRVGAGDILLDAQRKWLGFRDAACSAEIAPYAGGSIQPLIWFKCLTRQTVRRTADLHYMAEN